MMINKTKPHCYVLFVGGAADKESFLWGDIKVPFTDVWPHYTMREVAESFNQKLTEQAAQQGISQQVLHQQYRYEYLSYTEIFYDEIKDIDFNLDKIDVISNPKFQQLIERIGKNTHVYIVGHSLGGWNSAHLSHIFASYDITTDYLVTLDPVGTGNHETLPALRGNFIKMAQIYRQTPDPVAEHWLNVRGFYIQVAKKQLSQSFEDWVAWAGGQWLIEQSYPQVKWQLNENTDISHRSAGELFNYQTSEGLSASDMLVAAILKELSV
ncbi:hypothetical protein [Zophobihabitans entericus]|uniref:Uncharacterized protein n=1 Tax=Zophobihabitans entericus TaxID=1635327 RepID=A0A6G9IEK4_9GAMM|nr:hypothetical protein [Zophobihabitans entericus]QIQ22239.1 hypothetical protein IPMB12_11380 [Zophobihabitans entericus]